jgi:integrase
VAREKTRGWFFTDKRTPYIQYAVKFGNRRIEVSTGKEQIAKKDEAKEKRLGFEAAKAKYDASVKAAEHADLAVRTLGELCKVYWDRKGQPVRERDAQRGKAFSAADNLEWSQAWLIAELGADFDLLQISDNIVARVVTKRRGERKKDGKLVANATVNRSVRDPLRKMVRYAKKVLKVPTQEIDWGEFKLKEPTERVRDLAVAEENALFDGMRDDYTDAVDFAIKTGLRKDELIRLEWSHIDWDNRGMSIMDSKGQDAWMPIPDAAFAILLALRDMADRHPLRVFTFVAKRTLPARGYVAGRRYPLTYNGLRSAWDIMRKAAGLTNYRWHDNRHAAATRALRFGGNLRGVQKMMRHADVATTAKYAHALDQDVRDVMNAGANSGPVRSAAAKAGDQRSGLRSGLKAVS